MRVLKVRPHILVVEDEIYLALRYLMWVRFNLLACYCIIKRIYRQQMLVRSLLLLLLYLSLLLFQEPIGLFVPGLEPDLRPTRLLNVLLLITEVVKLLELLLTLSR